MLRVHIAPMASKGIDPHPDMLQGVCESEASECRGSGCGPGQRAQVP